MSLEDVFTGSNIMLQVNATRICSKCGGTRKEHQHSHKTCPVCGGRKTHTDVSSTASMSGESGAYTFLHAVRTRCARCSGEGWIVTESCSQCKGTGVTKYSKAVNVTIPAGCPNVRSRLGRASVRALHHFLCFAQGKVLLFENQGNVNKQGITGDVQVTITHRPHEIFFVHPKTGNLMADVEITFVESLLGFSHILVLLSGESFDVGRGGITLGGMSESFHGAGMPDGYGGTTDLVVLYTVSMPSQLTPAQQAVITRVLSPSSAAKAVIEQQVSTASAEAACSGEVWWDSTAGSVDGTLRGTLQDTSGGQADELQRMRQEALWGTADDELGSLDSWQSAHLWLWRLCFEQDCAGGSASMYPMTARIGESWTSATECCIAHSRQNQYRLSATCTKR